MEKKLYEKAIMEIIYVDYVDVLTLSIDPDEKDPDLGFGEAVDGYSWQGR